jgi:hypothetical protein
LKSANCLSASSVPGRRNSKSEFSASMRRLLFIIATDGAPSDALIQLTNG